MVENSSHRRLVLGHCLWLKPCVLTDNPVCVRVHVCVDLHILHILPIQGVWRVTTIFLVLGQSPFPEFLLPSNSTLPFRVWFLGLIAFLWTLHRSIHFALHYSELGTVACVLGVLLVRSRACRWPQLAGCPPDCGSQYQVCLLPVMPHLPLALSLWFTMNSQCLH